MGLGGRGVVVAAAECGGAWRKVVAAALAAVACHCGGEGQVRCIGSSARGEDGIGDLGYAGDGVSGERVRGSDVRGLVDAGQGTKRGLQRLSLCLHGYHHIISVVSCRCCAWM